MGKTIKKPVPENLARELNEEEIVGFLKQINEFVGNGDVTHSNAYYRNRTEYPFYTHTGDLCVAEIHRKYDSGNPFEKVIVGNVLVLAVGALRKVRLPIKSLTLANNEHIVKRLEPAKQRFAALIQAEMLRKKEFEEEKLRHEKLLKRATQIAASLNAQFAQEGRPVFFACGKNLVRYKLFYGVGGWGELGPMTKQQAIKLMKALPELAAPNENRGE